MNTQAPTFWFITDKSHSITIVRVKEKLRKAPTPCWEWRIYSASCWWTMFLHFVRTRNTAWFSWFVKGKLHPKIWILSSFAHHVISNKYDFFSV